MTSPIQEPQLLTLAQDFHDFASQQFRGASPLYEQLSLAIAGDQELLRIASLGRRNPRVLLFLGAVHYLLLEGAQHPLRDFYASLAEAPRSPEGAYPHFRRFCLEHKEEIVGLIATRLVQTNEVQRCASLLPAFVIASQVAHGEPLALIDVGAGAGLILLWDLYGYSYDQEQVGHTLSSARQKRVGNPDSPVQFTCEVRGEKEPPLPTIMPRIASRVGIDLNPIDVQDQREVLWLRALIWPEQKQRAELLYSARQLARRNPVNLIKGEAIDVLPHVVESTLSDSAPCIYHSYTLNQFPAQERERFSQQLHQLASEREQLFYISLEWLGSEFPQLEFTRFEAGVANHQKLAYCHPHGAWIEWLAD